MNTATLIYFCAMLASQNPTKIMDSTMNVNGKAYLINYQSNCECFNHDMRINKNNFKLSFKKCFEGK
jgi:hypothetical protein